MKLSKQSSAFVFAAALTLAPAADAALLLPAFQNGLNGWTVAGDITTVATPGGNVARLTTAHSTLEFGADAINLSGNDPLAAGGDLEDFIGMNIGGLDMDVLNQATEGSAMTVKMTVAVGDVLRFDWNLASLDPMGLDYAFFTVNGVLIHTLSSGGATSPSVEPYGNETGTATMSYQFTSAGEVELAFGVVDIADYAGSTTLTLGNLAIPEPSVSLLAVLGVVPLLRRRRGA